MKTFLNFRIALAAVAAFALTLAMPSTAHAVFAGEAFQKVTYFCGTTFGTGSHSGKDAGNCKAIADGPIMAIDANMLLTKVYVIITSALTGTTALDVGDDDTSNGFVNGSLSVTLGTPGMYGWNAKTAGAYLRIQTPGATDAADIFVVPNAKFYSVAKTMSLDITTANTAGAFQVVAEGYKFK